MTKQQISPTQQRRARRYPIGAKIITLLGLSLLASVTAIIVNATTLFRKDNINNIYVSSELLTSAKAGEVKFWLDSINQRGQLLGAALLGAGDKSAQATLDRYKQDPEILVSALYRANGSWFELQRSWTSPLLSTELEMSSKQIQDLLEGIKPAFTKLSAGESELRRITSVPSTVALQLSTPLKKPGQDFATHAIVLIVRPLAVSTRFADTGPYTVSLVNDQGALIFHPSPEILATKQNLLEVPLVQRMVTSRLEREFQEFSLEGIPYLGAYAKVGFAGLGVISQVPRAIAFETGDLLVRRSTYIALVVLSLAFIIAYIVVQNIIAPIMQLRIAADRIAKGNFGVSVQVKSRDEIFDLAQSFNMMSSEISRKIDNLSQINAAAQTISTTIDRKSLLEFSTRSLKTLLKSHRAVAWFKDRTGKSAEGGSQALTQLENWFEKGESALPRMTRELATAKAPFKTEQNGHPYLVAPIRERATVSGYIILADPDGTKGFQEEDLFMAGTVASSVSAAFENIRLLAETADKARMEKELETAKHVQDTMFPPSSLRIGGLEIESYYTPAAECGGDWWGGDWWGCARLSEHEVLLAMGDATGHGVPSAMVTATAKAACSVIESLSSTYPELARAPDRVLELLNKAIYDSTHGKILMTFFVVVMNTLTGEIKFANASHDPIYLYRMPEGADPGSPGSKANFDVLLAEPGPRLGQGPKGTYTVAEAKLSPGDFFFLYTDGLPEAKNPAQDEYGERKYTRSIIKHAHKPTAEIRDLVLADFWAYVNGEVLHDDVTLAVCRFVGPTQ